MARLGRSQPIRTLIRRRFAPVIAPHSIWKSSTNTVQAGVDAVVFTDYSLNSPTSWSWDFGTGASPATATGQGPHSVTYSTPGTATVQLTATNSAGSHLSQSQPPIQVVSTAIPDGPTVVREGFNFPGPTKTYLDVDVTGGRTMFLSSNAFQSSAWTTDNPGVTLVASNAEGNWLANIFAIAEGTTGVVRFTGTSVTMSLTYAVIDGAITDATAHYQASNTTFQFPEIPHPVTTVAPVVCMWVKPASVGNMGVPAIADWTTVLAYNGVVTVAPSGRVLSYSNAAIPVGTFTTPAMSRGSGTAAEHVYAGTLVVTGPLALPLADTLGLTDTVALEVAPDRSDTLALTDSVVAAPPPKTGTLTDNFSGSLAKWPGSSGVSIAAGRAEIPSTGAYNRLDTAPDKYDLTGSNLLAQVTINSQGGTRETTMEVRVDGGTDNRAIFLNVGGYLYFNTYTAGVGTTHEGATYSPTTHAWWRFHSTGTNDIRFSTSPDGVTWTEHTVATVSWPTTALDVRFMSGYWGSETDDYAYVDNVNLPPSVLTASPSDDLGLTDTVALAASLDRADTPGLTDSVTAVPTVGGTTHTRDLSDTEALTDTATRAVDLARSDVPGLTDAAARTVDLARADTLPITDTVPQVISLDRPDTPSLTDSASRAVTLDRSDSTGLSDTATTSGSGALAFADTLALTDSVALVVSADRGDTEALTDLVASTRAFGRDYSDTPGLTDTVASAVTLDRTYSDTLPVTDTATRAVDLARPDTLPLTDSVAVAVVARSLADTLPLADTVATVASSVRDYSDTLALSDISSVAGSGAGDFTDGLGLLDSVATVRNADRAYADTEALSDTVSRLVSLDRSDALPATDSATRVAEVDRSDVPGLTDSATTSGSGAASFTDTPGLTDTVALTVSVDRADAPTLADTVTVGGEIARTYSDTEALTDSVTASITLARSYVDTEALTDARALAVSPDRSDAEALTDSVVTVASTVRAYADTIGLTDEATVTLVYARAYADTLPVTDTISVAYVLARTYSDTLPITDTVASSVIEAVYGYAGAYSVRGPQVTQYAHSRPAARTEPSRPLVGAAGVQGGRVTATRPPSTVKGTS